MQGGVPKAMPFEDGGEIGEHEAYHPYNTFLPGLQHTSIMVKNVCVVGTMVQHDQEDADALTS